MEGRAWFPTTWEGELVGGGSQQPVYSLLCGRAGDSGLYLREMGAPGGLRRALMGSEGWAFPVATV